MKITEIRIPQYEKVVKVEDKASELKAFISIHNTRLGPGLGGIRMWPYKTEEAALEDVLHLSKAMSYKAAVSGLSLGGGKAVIWGDPKKDKHPELFQAMGEAVESLKGKYIATEDAGINVADVELVATCTKHVTGLSKGSGDPSVATGRGVFYCIEEAVRFQFKRKSLEEVRILVQGVGHVGTQLLEHLKKTGAKITVTDIDREKVDAAVKQFGVDAIPLSDLFKKDCDIFSPCALGQVVTPDNVESLKCKVISGGANNQLKNEDQTARLLHARGILHSPDYVSNAGGLINIYVIDILKERDVESWLRKIPVQLKNIFEISKKENIPPLFVANRIAEERMKKGRVD
jgi:leucine dehydrogenase